MSLIPLLRRRIYPTVISSIRHTRTSRPSIKIGKERFELTVDVRHYNRDEIRVKAHPQYLIIEGKRERKTAQGSLIAQFIKRYRLPEGCKIKEMESRLSPEGTLVIYAPRSCGDPELCDTVLIPISSGDPKKQREIKEPPKMPKVYPSPCDAYLKVKPKPPGN